MWQLIHAKAFDVLHGRSRLLVTTRDRSMMTALARGRSGSMCSHPQPRSNSGLVGRERAQMHSPPFSQYRRGPQRGEITAASMKS